MFDTETGIVRLKNQFLDIVSEHPNIKFLYVNGNNDTKDPFWMERVYR